MFKQALPAALRPPRPLRLAGTAPLLLALLLGAAACGDGDGQSTAADCSTATGQDRDRCLHDEIRLIPSTGAAEVLKKAQLIEDPMIQGAAVSSWIKDNNANVPQQEGQQLCALLQGRDQSYCLRRLSSPHLQR